MRNHRKAADKARSIRTRVLAIALAPCLAVVLIAAALAGYLVYSAVESYEFADDRAAGVPVNTQFVRALQDERKVTMSAMSGSRSDAEALPALREKTDSALRDILAYAGRLAADHVPGLAEVVEKGREAQEAMPGLREQLDSGDVPPSAADEAFSRMIGLVPAGAESLSAESPDGGPAFEHVVSARMLSLADTQARAHAIALAGVRSDLKDIDVDQLIGVMAAYRNGIDATLLSYLNPDERERATALVESEAWKEMLDGDERVASGDEDRLRGLDVDTWDAAADDVTEELVGLYASHATFASDTNRDIGRDAVVTAVVSGVCLLLLAVAAAAAAWVLADRLVKRLRRLREQTLALAEYELPELIGRISSGQETADEVDWLDHGSDEIGQVADAFNTAQRTAIDAAVSEAKTRNGVRKVFLSIAHRNQAIVHRQLGLLDELERSESDAAELDRLFRLDHLATRSRRNAENLIVLSGEKVGRQWSTPIALREVLRASAAETENYKRISVSKVPDVLVDGSAVADIGHLFAELLDNGTSFSPPESHVSVRGNIVGHGVAVEIEDQGLGIEPDRREELNAMLAAAPEFGVMALSDADQVGLFVVARLAAKHGIRVALRESIYGGTTAVVVIPTHVLASVAGQPPSATPPAPRQAPADESDTVAQPVAEEPAEPEPAPSSTPARTRVALPLPAEDESAAAGNGAPAGTKDRRRPLPKRARQANLAPQLQDDPVEPEEPAPAGDADEASHRSRAASLGAFQRGTLRARDAEPPAKTPTEG